MGSATINGLLAKVRGGVSVEKSSPHVLDIYGYEIRNTEKKPDITFGPTESNLDKNVLLITIQLGTTMTEGAL
jgi:hypothetical protein